MRLYDMGDDNVSDAEEIKIEKPLWLDFLNNTRCGLSYCIGAPAREILSLKIPLAHRPSLDVFGVIKIEDHDGTSYVLYSRDIDDVQTLTHTHNSLSLCIPTECNVSNDWARMTTHLQDKADGSVIVHHSLPFDKLTPPDDYNRLHVCQLGNSALLAHAAFSTAVIAVVGVTLIKKNHVPAAADIYGTVVARYGNTYGQKYPGILLFNKPSNHPVTAVSDIPINLSRDVVVVPAYSFLRIELRLFDTNQQDFNGSADFLANYDYNFVEVAIEGKDFDIQVSVHWGHPYQLEDHAERRFKRPKICSDQHLNPTFSRGPFVPKHNLQPYSLVEVFTVMINQDIDNVINIYGRVGIEDYTTMRFEVFKRNEMNPVTLSTKCNTIPIKGPSRCFIGPEYLAMGLTLRDVSGRVFLQGSCSWAIDSVDRPISWYDKRICAVLRGVHCYATVFYTIFLEAMQAHVKVSFTSNCDPDVSCRRVYGTIVARYSNEYYDVRYSTEYEKACFQSVLFKEPRGNSLELKPGCTVPLLKSMVAVPADASLIVDVDLYASYSSDESSEEQLGKVEFGTVVGTNGSWDIQSKSHGLKVSIEWIDFFEACKRWEESALRSEELP